MRIQLVLSVALAGSLAACSAATAPTTEAPAVPTAAAPDTAAQPQGAQPQGAAQPMLGAGDMTLDNLPGEKATGEIQTTPSGLRYIVMKEGTGAKPGPTSTVKVDYTGYLTNGTKFDSSIDSGQPATFPLNGVISGWTEGVQLMSPGAKYKFIVPPELGYGAGGYPPVIPGNAALVFDIELHEVK